MSAMDKHIGETKDSRADKEELPKVEAGPVGEYPETPLACCCDDRLVGLCVRVPKLANTVCAGCGY